MLLIQCPWNASKDKNVTGWAPFRDENENELLPLIFHDPDPSSATGFIGGEIFFPSSPTFACDCILFAFE